ncbi:MAG: lipopolysaccharide biosynthesis protein [Acidaminococcaceae bacterium]
MARNRTKLFALNTTASALQQVVLFVVGLIIPGICLRYYGSEINGLVSSITQFISYITLIEAGISASIVFYLYKPLSENNTDKIGSIVSAARTTYNKLGYAVIGLSVLLAVGYMLLASVNTLTPMDVFVLVLSMGVAGSLEFFTMARYRVLLTADQRTYVLCFATILGSILNAIVTVLCAVFGLSIVWIKIITIFTVYARSIILYLYFKKNYSNINVHSEPDYSSLNKRWDAVYMQVLWSLQSGAPIIIVTAFTDMVTVSIYTIYNLVIYGINNLVSIFMSGLQAAFGEILVSGDKNLLKNTYRQFTFAFYSALAVIYAITFSMFMPFITLYTSGIPDSTKYYLPLLGVLFCINGFLFSIKTPQGMMVIAAGLYKETKIQTTIQGAILVIGGVVLTGIFNLGLYGVVIAGIASNAYRAIDFVIYISKNLVSNSNKGTIFNMLMCVITITLTYLVSSLICIFIPGPLGWVINCCLVGVFSLSFVLIWSLVFQKRNLLDVVGRVKQLFRR